MVVTWGLAILWYYLGRFGKEVFQYGHFAPLRSFCTLLLLSFISCLTYFTSGLFSVQRTTLVCSLPMPADMIEYLTFGSRFAIRKYWMSLRITEIPAALLQIGK